MLEEIYKLLGYEEDVFTIKSKEIKAHNHLMEVLLKCKELGIIISSVNEDRIDEIERET